MATAALEQRLAALTARYDALESAAKMFVLQQRLSAVALRLNSIEKKLLGKPEALISTSPSPSTVCSSAPLSTVDTHIDPVEWTTIPQDDVNVAKIRRECKKLNLRSAKFVWVPSDYYNQKLAWRRDILNAPSTAYLCKCIVLENTHCVNPDCSDPKNSRYYACVFQYIERFDAELVMRFIRSLNEGLGKKKFNFRLAADGEQVTGFVNNAVVPFGLVTKMPIILSSNIPLLPEGYFWMGGGHVDCKLRIETAEFIKVLNPFVASMSVAYPKEELDNL